jgi:hypothetical protein
VGLGEGVGEAVGVGDGVGEGVGVGLAVGVGKKCGVGLAVGVGVMQPIQTVGVGEGLGEAVGLAVGVGEGVGVTPTAGSGPVWSRCGSPTSMNAVRASVVKPIWSRGLKRIGPSGASLSSPGRYDVRPGRAYFRRASLARMRCCSAFSFEHPRQ